MDYMSSNFFGGLYPSYDHGLLVDIFRIKPNDKVLDVGGGHNPFSRADNIIDSDLTDGNHRDGRGIPPVFKDRYMKGDLHSLPFEDKTFDFIFCSHVLEHVSDPETACRELMRVGKRGYIETPRKWTEFFAGYPSHRWLIDVIDNELIFEKRQFIESPYLNCALHSAWKYKKLEEYGLKRFRNLSCVQFYWENSFKMRVINKDNTAFDYSNPEHAALSHYYFALNILLMDAPPEHGIFHAETSAKLCPDTDIFQALCAAYSIILNKKELWLKSSRFLYDKNILNFKDSILLRAGAKKRLFKKLMTFLAKNAHGQYD